MYIYILFTKKNMYNSYFKNIYKINYNKLILVRWFNMAIYLCFYHIYFYFILLAEESLKKSSYNASSPV